jgi:hypothetical protein
MTRKWVGVYIRFAKQELGNIDAHCKKYNLKRSDFIRSSVRDKIYNTDPSTGATKQKDNSVDLIPVIDNINLLSKKFDSLEKKFDSNFEGKDPLNSTAKQRVMEAILQVMQRATDPFTTTEKLADRIKRIDPSLEQFLFASATNGVSAYEDALTELHRIGKLRRSATGIVEFKGVVRGAQRKKD